MVYFRISLLILAAAFLSACQPEIQTAPPVPSVSIWQVQVTPATAWLAPFFQTCAADQPGVNLVVSEHPVQALDVQAADFAFQWGERADAPPFAAVIGQDQLAVVVNPANPIASLTVSEMQALFSGKEDSWSQLVQQKCPTCGSFGGSTRVYIYASGGEMQLAADWIAAGPDDILAPDPAAVVAAVAGERYAIGFIPARWLDSTVKRVAIVDAEAGLLSRPVLAMASAEPQGARRAWLLCVQEQMK